MQDITNALDELQEYTGFWRRTAAAILDSILFALILIPLVLALSGGDMAALEQTSDMSVVSIFINYVLPFAITMLFWTYYRATPGKMLLDCEIVDAETFESASTQQLVLRYVCYFISALPLLLGFFWIAWDSRKQGFHDKIAGTVVIRKNGS